jgi:hypothetical protein
MRRGPGVKSKIPAPLMPELVKRRAEGQTLPEIAKWLHRQHRISVTMHTIGHNLKNMRRVKNQVTQHIVEEELRPIIMSDIDRIGELIDEAKTIATAFSPNGNSNGDPDVVLKAIETQRKLLEMRLRYSGVSGNDEGDKTVNNTYNVQAQGPVVLLPPEEPL